MFMSDTIKCSINFHSHFLCVCHFRMMQKVNIADGIYRISIKIYFFSILCQLHKSYTVSSLNYIYIYILYLWVIFNVFFVLATRFICWLDWLIPTSALRCRYFDYVENNESVAYAFDRFKGIHTLAKMNIQFSIFQCRSFGDNHNKIRQTKSIRNANKPNLYTYQIR